MDKFSLDAMILSFNLMKLSGFDGRNEGGRS